MRTAFANDPLNLHATDGPTNTQKGDGDAATWLPPNEGFPCEYGMVTARPAKVSWMNAGLGCYSVTATGAGSPARTPGVARRRQ